MSLTLDHTTAAPATIRHRVAVHEAREVRPEIQALRALAVTLVVLYHLWPAKLRGGYVGVDVFFAISGFLITSHIYRGLESGRFSLLAFYARRIKRLLPASLLVLLTVGIATLLWVPQSLWSSIGQQVMASTFYVQNWVLGADSVDYLAAGAGASPIQHFWSLSTEEQFYLLWPILLGASVVVGRRIGRARLAALVTMVLIVGTSFAYSIFDTAHSPSWAYFATPTRAWEFGAGGLLALLGVRSYVGRVVRVVATWAGVAMIAIAALWYNAATPFPGYAALLPVVGTLLVIRAGAPGGLLGPARLYNWRPVRFLGDISYSLYLWHWPLIVLVPLAVGGSGFVAPQPLKLAVLIASVVLAWLSKRFVEDPIRSLSPRGSARASRTFIVAVSAMLLVASVGGAAYEISRVRVSDAQAELASAPFGSSCFGAPALTSLACGSGTSGPIYPDPIIAAQDVPTENCQARADRAIPLICEFGSTAKSAPRVALVGDSHANQWTAALARIASRQGWHLTTYFKSSCPYTSAVPYGSSCAFWNAAVRSDLLGGHYKIVFTSSANDLSVLKGTATDAVAAAGFRGAWSDLIAHGEEVVALADIPRPLAAGVPDPPSCVESGKRCDVGQHEALHEDPEIDAAQALPAVKLLDLNASFCSHGDCPAVIGHVLVYRDGNHMTATFARSLIPALTAGLRAAGVLPN